MRARFLSRWDNWGMVVTDPEHGRPTPPRSIPLAVRCPAIGARVEVRSANGKYRCPDCGRDITVESLEAAHG